MLPLVEDLIGALEAEGVAWCHWKSNVALLEAAAGEDDLDLLIGHSSRQSFLAVLARLQFKEAVSAKGWPRFAGVSSFFGWDAAAGRIVHVHAHDKLVLGHDLTKNCHLPIEDAYLASSVRQGAFRVPAPEFEFAVFVVRMTLKYSRWGAVLGRRPALSKRERKELEAFEDGVPPARIREVLASALPFVEVETWTEALRALRPGVPAMTRVRAGRRMQAALRACRMRPGGREAALRCWRRIALAARFRLLRGSSRKTLKNGGLLVGVIGGDGAGKTTVIDGAAGWLGRAFATAKVHLGKPGWSAATILVRGFLKVGRALRLWSFSRVPLDILDNEHPLPFPGYPPLIRAVCTARDRFRAYIRARRLADRGRLVICDRFPLPRLIQMDGPRIAWLTRTSRTNGLIRALARIEERYYRAILPPDLLIVLRVDPETAVGRKVEDNAGAVRVRTNEIWTKDWTGTGARIIDAGAAPDQVLREAQALIWSHL